MGDTNINSFLINLYTSMRVCGEPHKKRYTFYPKVRRKKDYNFAIFG